jgi:hypothetical protein
MDDEIHKKILEKFTNPSTAIAKQDENITKAEKDFENDYQFSRKKLRDLVTKGEEAVNELLAITLETKEPGAFKVLSELLNTVGNLSGKVVDTAKQKSEINSNLNGGTNIKTQNNTVFIGTAQEFLKKNKEDDAIIEAEIIKDE